MKFYFTHKHMHTNMYSGKKVMENIVMIFAIIYLYINQFLHNSRSVV